ncbi:MAG: amino acid racemase [Pseudomonadota bacterium]|nr:amino acid racemase [Pseudomonadota bacterium]
MKTIGLIGGVSTEATLIYYKTINAEVRRRRGGYHSAEMRIHSVNFHDYNGAHDTRDWEFIRAGFDRAAKGLKSAGADFIVLACNTLHTVADAIENATDLPFLHIVDACGARLKRDGFKQPGLFGTAFTMSEPYFVDRLERETGICATRPDAVTQKELSRIIFDDLTHGIVREEAIAFYQAAISDLKTQGCDSIILGCTELGMLINDQNSPLPAYDTALVHCDAIVDFALNE